VDRNLWFTLHACDDMLREAYHEAKRQQEWALASYLQASRARLLPHVERYRDVYTPAIAQQMSLVDAGAGRAHDVDPAA
jgi:hypothetical protein